jgi:hypothetical protein
MPRLTGNGLRHQPSILPSPSVRLVAERFDAGTETPSVGWDSNDVPTPRAQHLAGRRPAIPDLLGVNLPCRVALSCLIKIPLSDFTRRWEKSAVAERANYQQLFLSEVGDLLGAGNARRPEPGGSSAGCGYLHHHWLQRRH